MPVDPSDTSPKAKIMDAGGLGMNIFEIPRNQWWEYMKPIMQNINLNKVSMLQNNHMVFSFLNSYNGKFYKSLSCKQILKCCIENWAFENEEFAYFVPDVFLKKLSKTELESSLIYYKYGYNVDFSKLCDQYLILIFGNEICIDMICGDVEVLDDKDELSMSI